MAFAAGKAVQAIVTRLVGDFGLAAAILGVIGFDKAWFPSKGPSHTCKVRVAVGYDLVEAHTSGGEFPDIRLFNEMGHAIGQLYDYHEAGVNKPRVYIGQGEHYDVEVPQDNAQQPTYYSGVDVRDAEKICTWIDSDHTATDIAGFQVHFPEFTADSDGGYKNDTDYYCKNTPVLEFRKEWSKHGVFWKNDEEIAEAEAAYNERRSINGTQPTRKSHPAFHPEKAIAAFRGHLTKSHFADQSATALCESETSSGPDYLSFEEGRFCDMETRTVWPLCVRGDDQDCFDVEAQDMRLFTRVGKREVPDLSMAKNYTRVSMWGSSQ